jgi:hypothetical protein
MWFSNTYAWTPSRLIPSYKSTTALKSYNYSSYANGYGNYYDELDEIEDYNSGFNIKPRTPSAHNANYDEAAYDFPDDEDGFVQPTPEELFIALEEADVETLEICMESMPAYTITTVLHNFTPNPTSYTHRDDLPFSEQCIYDMLMEGDASGLISSATNSYTSAGIIAEVMCYYMLWTERKQPSFKPIVPALLS